MSFLDLEVRGSVAVVWLDRKDNPVNKLTPGLFSEFSDFLDRLEEDRAILAAVLISRKPSVFIAGADIEGFEHMRPGEAASLSHRGNALLSRLEASSKPVVAAIHGAALGGGLEVALACHHRVASDSSATVLGLPEVKLGLLPAGGGTQRLPRLVGLQPALELLMTGKNVYPRPALRLGLVDRVVHSSLLLQAALFDARAITGAAEYNTRHKRGIKALLVDRNPLIRWWILRVAEQRIRDRTGENYPAPFRILDCVRQGFSRGFQAGLEREGECLEELVRTPQSQELRRLFFAVNRSRRVMSSPGAAEPIRRIGVIGTGLMGCGVAEVSSQNEFRVVMKDLNRERLSGALQRIQNGLEERVHKGILTPFQRDLHWSRLWPTTEYADLKGSELILEAVFEELELKRRILSEVEECTDDRTIFASNTSALPIAEIAAGARRPGQVVGMHYFSPVQKMPLLEIVVTPQTSRQARDAALTVGRRQGKTPIVVRDGPGFYTTRVLAPLLNEAVLLLEEGVPIADVDVALKRFGFPLGPLALLDEVGLDVAAHVTRSLRPLFQKRGIESSRATERLLEAGLHGKKGGRGFYLHEEGARHPNPEVRRFFDAPGRSRVRQSEIQQRLSLVMINEAIHCLQEEVLASPLDGDLGAVLGLGFPPFLGGPFRYSDRLGPDELTARLEACRDRHGVRFEPAGLLRDMARNKAMFYRDE